MDRERIDETRPHVRAYVGRNPKGRISVVVHVGPSPGASPAEWMVMFSPADSRRVAAMLLNVADEADAFTAASGS